MPVWPFVASFHPVFTPGCFNPDISTGYRDCCSQDTVYPKYIDIGSYESGDNSQWSIVDWWTEPSYGRIGLPNSFTYSGASCSPGITGFVESALVDQINNDLNVSKTGTNNIEFTLDIQMV